MYAGNTVQMSKMEMVCLSTLMKPVLFLVSLIIRVTGWCMTDVPVLWPITMSGKMFLL